MAQTRQDLHGPALPLLMCRLKGLITRRMCVITQDGESRAMPIVLGCNYLQTSSGLLLSCLPVACFLLIVSHMQGETGVVMYVFSSLFFSSPQHHMAHREHMDHGARH